MNGPLILGFPDYEPQARKVADRLGASHALVQIHRFPDGESLVTLPTPLPERIVFVRSLDHPNDKLIELMLASTTAQQLGAQHITLVAPYLCYMRQDTAFHPGESVSQKSIGAFLGSLCDALVTVDPHLHRTRQLCDAVPVRQALTLSATPLLAQFIKERFEDVLLLGPDVESEQWVAAIAQATDFDYRIAKKHRTSDRQVKIALPEGRYATRNILIVDDVMSTGHTLATAAAMLRAAGTTQVDALVTHALCAPGAMNTLRDAGVRNIWSTDSIPHSSNSISLTPLLADATMKCFRVH